MKKEKLEKMAKAEWMKKAGAAALAAVMAVAAGSPVLANAQALPEGTVVGEDNKQYLVGENGEKCFGWFIDLQGDWYYFQESDRSMKTGWHHDENDGHWYYLNLADGKMLTGWQAIEGKEYFFQPDKDRGNYYFDDRQAKWEYSDNGSIPYGAMYTNTVTPDGSAVDSHGAKVAPEASSSALEIPSPTPETPSSAPAADYSGYTGEYTLENNYHLLSSSSLWLTVTKIQDGKVWANAQAGAGTASGEAYGEVAGAEMIDGRFTIVMDNIMCPLDEETVQPYNIDFTFLSDNTIESKANGCIYTVLNGYQGKLLQVSGN